MELDRNLFSMIVVLALCSSTVQAAAPVFSTPNLTTGTRYVDENAREGVSILKIEAIDADGDPLTYSILTQVPNSPPFELDNTTGVLKTPFGLDAETILAYNFTFRVSDGETTVDSIPFNVIVNDLNEFDPVFTAFSVTIVESVPIGYLVTTVTATDKDAKETVTYRITTGNSENVFAISNNGEIKTTAKLTGPATYKLNIQASDGTKSNSMAITITVKAMPSAVPHNFTLESNSSKSVIVRWQPPSCKCKHNEITGYKIRYKKQGTRRMKVVTLGRDKEVYTLTNLDKDTTYKVRVIPQTVQGNGPPSDWLFAKTFNEDLYETRVPDQLDKLLIRSTKNSVFVQWIPKSRSNILVRGYIIKYGKGIPDVHEELVDANTSNITIGNLEPAAEYVVSVRAVNNKGEGRPLYQTVFTKADKGEGTLTPMVPPINVKSNILSATTVILQWNDNSLGKAQRVKDGRYYTVRYRSALPSSNRFKYVNTTELYCHIDDLHPDTVYTFSVKVTKGQRKSAWSISVTNKTQEAPAPASAPRNVVATSHGPHRIMIEWDEPGKLTGIIHGYKVFYTTQPDLPIVHWEITVVMNGHVALISGLDPDKMYTISVLAFNRRGQGPLSLPVRVMTRREVPDDKLLGLKAIAMSPNEIEVRWDPPEDVESIISYTLYYHSSLQPQKGQITIYPPTTRYTLSDLTPDTKYQIQVDGRSAQGEVAKTVLVQVKTPEFIPGEPRNVQVQPVNSTTIRVEWRPPKTDALSGIIRGYFVYYAEVNVKYEPKLNTERMEDTKNEGNTNEIIISGLKPDTRYFVSVAGYTRRGDGVRSRAKLVTTKGAVPSSPRHLVAELLQQEPPMVQVTWHKPEHIYGELKGYQVYWGLMWGVYQRIMLKPNQQSFIAKTLDRGKIYEFHVLARNGVGYGEKAVVTIITPEGGPPTPENVRVVWTSPQTIQVTWDEPSRDNQIAMYRVYYSSFKIEDMSLWQSKDTDGPATMVTITVMKGTSYAIKVKAKSVDDRWSNLTKAVVAEYLPQVVPSAVPLNFTLEPTSSTIILVRWQPPPREYLQDEITGYKIRYRKQGTREMNVIQLAGDRGVYTLTNLDKDTIYNVQIAPQTVQGSKPPSDWLSAKTFKHDLYETSVPDQVDQLVVHSTNNALTVQWVPNRRSIILVRRYIIGYGAGFPDVYQKYVDANTFNITIENLQPATEYVVSIRADNNKGQGRPLYTTVLTKAETAPGSPLTLSLIPMEFDPLSVTLTWQPPAKPNEQVTGYLVYYTTDLSNGDLSWVVEGVIGERSSITISDLTWDTIYYFKVKARNRIGYGPMSPIAIYRTPSAPTTTEAATTQTTIP